MGDEQNPAAAMPADDAAEDEVDLLCTQLLRRLNQLKMRKAADIALKKICDATINELKMKSKEVKARCYKRQNASSTYTETIAETEVASSKVVATADAVKTILNNDVDADDAADVPDAPAAEADKRGKSGPVEAAKPDKRKKKRKRAGARG